MQGHINLTILENLLIPTKFNLLAIQIEIIIKNANNKLCNSKYIYRQTEQLLLKTLGLENWQATPALNYERKSSEVFAAGRLDAEFFSPKIIQLIKLLNKDKLTIQDVAPVRHERFKPNQSGTFEYIEISGLQPDGTALAETTEHQEAPSRATWYVKAGDVITSTVRPIRSLSAIISNEQEDFICSSGFVVLNPTEVASEVLLTYLKLPLVCELMDLYTSASLYPAISESDLLGLPFPKVDQKVQQEIIQKIQKSREQKQYSIKLLEAAKRAVEIAIEDSEAAALAYLQPFLQDETP